MKIVVLGGDGFCGWPTALHLSKLGHDIVIVDNLSRRNIDNELEKKGMKEKLYQFTKNYGFDVDEFENLGPAEKSKYIKYHIRKKYKEEKRTIKNESPLLSALHDFKMAFERDKNYF